jgi:hypothetical protein
LEETTGVKVFVNFIRSMLDWVYGGRRQRNY